MSLYWRYRQLRYGEPIVVVSGLPRSGTSMLMKMLDAGGVEIVQDGVRTADEDNPRGYYEHERVKNLAQESDRSWLRQARGGAIKIISHLLKELPGHFNYRVLLIRRSMEEVLASQGKMLEHRGEQGGGEDAHMAELLDSDIWRAGYLLKHAPQFEHIELHYSQVVDDARGQARRIRGFLERDMDVEKMAGVVDRQLYRNRAASSGSS